MQCFQKTWLKLTTLTSFPSITRETIAIVAKRWGSIVNTDPIVLTRSCATDFCKQTMCTKLRFILDSLSKAIFCYRVSLFFYIDLACLSLSWSVVLVSRQKYKSYGSPCVLNHNIFANLMVLKQTYCKPAIFVRAKTKV